MDFILNERQLALQSSLRALLADAAVGGKAGDCDRGLMHALQQAGHFGKRKAGGELLEAAIITEEVSKADRLAPVGLQVFLGSALFDTATPEPMAIQLEAARQPLRYAAQASILIVVGEVEARAYRHDPAQSEAVATDYVYPFAYPAADLGSPLGSWPAALVRRRWQLALAAEMIGGMETALQKIVAYLTDRKQFGKRIGSFQAIQHRLAELAVSVECSRLLIREAAWHDDSGLAASVACYAATAARQVCLDAHQLSGARGFTLEFNLYRSTLRLQALTLEARGATQHGAVAANELWAAPMTQLLGCGAGDQSTQESAAAPL